MLHSDKNKHDEKLKLYCIFYFLFILFYFIIITFFFFCEVIPVIQQRLAWTVSNVLLKDF